MKEIDGRGRQNNIQRTHDTCYHCCNEIIIQHPSIYNKNRVTFIQNSFFLLFFSLVHLAAQIPQRGSKLKEFKVSSYDCYD